MKKTKAGNSNSTGKASKKPGHFPTHMPAKKAGKGGASKNQKDLHKHVSDVGGPNDKDEPDNDGAY